MSIMRSFPPITMCLTRFPTMKIMYAPKSITADDCDKFCKKKKKKKIIQWIRFRLDGHHCPMRKFLNQFSKHPIP